MTHIVKTCREISEDVEPSSLPSIPKGHYGIERGPSTGDEYRVVDFGAPWGLQTVSVGDLLDAAAVLEGAKRALTYLKRPWRGVIRRTLRTFAGPYLKLATRSNELEFCVEDHLFGKGKKDALALLDGAIALTGQRSTAASPTKEQAP